MTILLLGILLVVLMTGVPIFAGLGVTALGFIAVASGTFGGLADQMFGKLSSYLLIAIPLFALMAEIMVRTRIVDDLFAFLNALVGHLPGGLAIATVLCCTVFAAISGSSATTALTVAAIAAPQMKRAGYPTALTMGTIAGGGTLGILIPPSGPMVLYSLVTDASIGALFVAGVVPGVVLAAAFAFYCYLRAVFSDDVPVYTSRAGAGEIWRLARRAIWALTLPPVIFGGIYLGVFTVTEAAAVSAVQALLIGKLVYRRLGWRDLFEAAQRAVRLSAILFMIIAAAVMFGTVLTLLRVPAELSAWIAAAGLGKYGFLVAVCLLLLFLGMFLESVALILIVTPIVLPALSALGIDLVWFGVQFVILLEVALLTPPVGMNLFVLRAVTRERFGQIVIGSMPFVAMLLLGWAAIVAVPALALWLPQTMAASAR
ncbi:MAG: TRAP transporter large permease [Rhodospirillales bacterium]|nr:TRAP transporter large permease [Rhodospirillales bacterium]